MLKSYFLIFALVSVGLCQYPFVSDSYKFPEVFVVRENAPSLQVNLQHYFHGFNLSYSLAPPALEKVTKIPITGSKTRVLFCSPTAPTINGRKPTHIILQGNELKVVFEDSKTSQYPVVSAEANVDCFDIIAAPSDPSLFLICHNSTSKQNNIYLISSLDFQMKKKIVVPENFSSPASSIKRECKGGHIAFGINQTIFRFYLFSVSPVTKEWLIHEFVFDQGLHELLTGNLYSSDSSPNNTLQNLQIMDFVPFEDRLILYDEKDKVLINYYKHQIQSVESIRKLVYSEDGNFTIGVSSMSGAIRESNLQEQILLNIEQEIYHFSIGRNGDIIFKNSYKPIQSLRIIDSLFLNDELFILANNGFQNRITIYNIHHFGMPVYFEADDDDTEEGARFFEDPYDPSRFVKVDSKGIIVFKRNPAVMTINSSWTKDAKDFELLITSKNRFVKEYDQEYPSERTLKVVFKVIYKTLNDVNVHALRQKLGSTLVQHPERQIIDLHGVFDGPALNINVEGITQSNLKNYGILEPTTHFGAPHTIVTSSPSGEIIILQESRVSGGSIVEFYKGQNNEGRQLAITKLHQVKLNSPVRSIHAEHYPLILLVTDDPIERGANTHKIVAIDLGRKFQHSLDPAEIVLKDKYCDQLHFSRDPEYSNRVYCLNKEEQKLSIYHFDKIHLKLIQDSALQGPSYFGGDLTIEGLASIDTHEKFPGILILRYIWKSKLGFYSWHSNDVIASEYLGTADYVILPHTLLVIDYNRESIQVRDIEYVTSLQIEGKYGYDSWTQGMSERSHNLDLYQCTPVHGSAYSPVGSNNLYLRAKCPQSPHNLHLLAYNFQNEARVDLKASIKIPQAENTTIQSFGVGSLLDSDHKLYDLFVVNGEGKTYFYAFYESPHVIFDTIRNSIHLTETINVFSIHFEAYSHLGDHSNKKQAELILTVAKLQSPIKKRSINHTEIVPFNTYLSEHGADISCFHFNPFDLWEGSVLELDHSITLSSEHPRSEHSHDGEFLWLLNERYKIYDRLFERHSFQAPGTWSFKPMTSHIYYFESDQVIIASKSDPERSQKILNYNSREDSQAIQNVKVCKLEGCFVGVGTRNDIVHYAKFFGISDDYQMIHYGDAQYNRAPSAFALSDDDLFFGVFDYDHQLYLNETFLSVYDVRNPSRNWTIKFESVPLIVHEGFSVGFHGIDVSIQSPGVYVAFISTNATGFVSCDIKLSESQFVSSLKCYEYNFNVVRSDLVFDEVPSWTEIRVLSQVKLTSNPIDSTKNLTAYTVLIAGTNTPIYIVDVTPGKGFGILQGFVNYHPLGSQLQITLNTNYLITYVTYRKNNAKEFDNYLYFYKIIGNNSVKVSKDDEWALEEAIMRVRVDKQDSNARSLVEIDPNNNTVYLLDPHNSKMTLNEIFENSTICIHWDVEVASDSAYDLTISAKNDLGSQGYVWKFSPDHHLKENTIRHNNRFFTALWVVLVVLCFVFSVATAIKQRKAARRTYSSANESFAEIPEAGSSYRPLTEL